MASYSPVMASLPSSSLFLFPPNPNQMAVPPSMANPGWAYPIAIPDALYTAALDPRVPLTIATVYAITVKSLNVYNKRNGKKAWALARTRTFAAFVIAHNVFLAAYSAWTFWGMLGGMMRSVVNPWTNPTGLAGTVDSFCQLNGGAGLGEAVWYNETTSRWVGASGFSSAGIDAATGLPSRDSRGRIWNEGLAYYGWIFYLSKFYEVLDTFIILAKGKQSSTLQTYHHAGAMMCMWAGIRYMAAPIWMFVLVNSGIHAMMYTYYTITAFSIRVPTAIKRTLTTLQITQFLVGASYAMAHSFVSYTMPVQNAAQPIAKGAYDGVKSVVSKASEAAAAPSAAGVHDPAALTSQTVLVTQPCVTTSGETFAIWLNVLYLAPLTYLFVKFFISSYLRRSSAEATRIRPKNAPPASNVALAEKAGWEAAKATQREVYADLVGEEEQKANGQRKTSGQTAARH